MAALSRVFLSCLCGSEQLGACIRVGHFFLSCLCGSERQRQLGGQLALFLSCLCGSEREPTTVLALPLVSELPMRQ